MTTIPTSPVSLLDPALVADPFPFFAEMRATAPAVWLSRHHAWLLTSYEPVRAAFRDPRLSSDRLTPLERRLPPEQRAALGRTFELLRGWMVFHDPPEHERLREPLRRAFTPRRISELTPRIEAIVADLLDDLAGADEPDLIADFAFPLPAIVIAELLGVPAADREEFKHWSDLLSAIVFGTADRAGQAEQAAAGSERFADYFRWLIDTYTAEPADNLISALIAVTKEDPAGAGLTPSELVGGLTLLLFGGHETTTSLIGNSMRSLMTHRDQLDQFRQRPDEIARYGEELHRYDGSTKLMVRIVAEDHERFGLPFEAGQTVFLAVSAANRDPAAYAESDRLWLERPEPRQHLGFGYGIHFCLGAALARLESQLALRELVARFPDISFDPARATWRSTLVSRSPDRMPVALGRG